MNIGSAIRLYESYAKRAVLPRLRPGLRIVHVAPPWIEVPPMKYGGTEVVVERVAIGQQELGLNVAVLCRPGSTVPGAVHFAPRKQEWGEHLAQMRHDEIEMFYAIECVKWMKAELDAGHAIDIIHTHVRGAALLYICREFAEAKGIPVVHTVHLPVIGAEWTAERERYHEAQYAYLVGLRPVTLCWHRLQSTPRRRYFGAERAQSGLHRVCSTYPSRQAAGPYCASGIESWGSPYPHW